jgi:hypothetical protein
MTPLEEFAHSVSLKYALMDMRYRSNTGYTTIMWIWTVVSGTYSLTTNNALCTANKVKFKDLFSAFKILGWRFYPYLISILPGTIPNTSR